jgi:hypothetical protein
VKKIPLIGLIIGAVAAFFAMRKKKGSESGAHEHETPPTQS